MILRIAQNYDLCRTEHLNLNRITLLNKLETSKCEYAHISFKSYANYGSQFDIQAHGNI